MTDEKQMSGQRLNHKIIGIYDAAGRPSVMVRIPKFRWSDVVPGAPEEICSAFLVGGREIDAIYVSKYINTLEDGLAYSLPDKEPATLLSIDEARQACAAKGAGWHLMTNAEWAATALWCSGYLSDPCVPEGPDWMPETFGSVGRCWEFVAGFRLNEGRIELIPDNDAALNVDESSTSSCWRSVHKSGALVMPGTDGELYFENVGNGNDLTEINEIDGGVVLATAVTRPQYTAGSSQEDYACSFILQPDLPATDGIRMPWVLETIGISPMRQEIPESILYVRNYGERISIRGGCRALADTAGPYAVYLSHARTIRSATNGFRAVWIDPEQTGEASC